jgi:hypothetical protein
MFESHPGSSDPFSPKPSPHEQRFQSLVGYGREQQSGVFETAGERAQRFGRGVLGVIQRVDMVGSAQAGLGYADKAVGAAEKVLDNNRVVRFAEHVPIVGGHVRAARGVTEMARTVVDTGNQLTNSAGVLAQSPQARWEVARSGLSAARNSFESSMGIERGVDGRRKKVLRGLFKAAFNLFRTGGRSGVDALSEAGKAGARAAGASVFEQGQAYSSQTTPDNSPFMSSEPYEPFGPPKPYASYEESPDPFANLLVGKTDRVGPGGSLNRPEDIDIWGSVSTLGPGAIPPPPPPPSNRLQRTPSNPYGRW